LLDGIADFGDASGLPKVARAFRSLSTVSLSAGYQYSRWQFSHASSRSAPAWNTAFTSFRLTASSVARATFRTASIFASHRTGSLSSFAWISVGDNSGAFGPTLLFTSPGGVNGRGTLSR